MEEFAKRLLPHYVVSWQGNLGFLRGLSVVLALNALHLFAYTAAVALALRLAARWA